MWTRFWDSHSGGGQKLGAQVIWIEACEDDAIDLFLQFFGRNPVLSECNELDCCGADYWIEEFEHADIEPGHWVVTVDDIDRHKERLKDAPMSNETADEIAKREACDACAMR